MIRTYREPRSVSAYALKITKFVLYAWKWCVEAPTKRIKGDKKIDTFQSNEERKSKISPLCY